MNWLVPGVILAGMFCVCSWVVAVRVLGWALLVLMVMSMYAGIDWDVVSCLFVTSGVMMWAIFMDILILGNACPLLDVRVLQCLFE